MCRIIKATEEELTDGTVGACAECGEFAHSVEPDAEKYLCECCGECAVYGLEQLLLLGQLDLVDDEDG